MAKLSRADLDSPWKTLLDRLLPLCMAFFFPEIHADIDWSRGYESLDKELQRILRRAKRGTRVADKLFKVWLKSGEESWLLIHIEVQADKELGFPQRMYRYHHRISEYYDREVVSVAILADNDPRWRPRAYRFARWHFSITMRFPVAKLLDYARDWDALERSTNPFATVVMAHLKTLETRKSPEERYNWKLRLAKRLYEHGFEPQTVRDIFDFIDWAMELPPEDEDRFAEDIREIEEEKQMPFVNIFERKGLEQGRQEGRQEGREEALHSLELALHLKFGEEGVKLIPEIRALGVDEPLDPVIEAIKTAATMDELRRAWGKRRGAKKAK